MTTAVVYCRISRDITGAALGVERQRRECEALCEREGLDVVEVFVDNDISAFSGRTRPSYKRMGERLEDGGIDVLVAWHPDRLTRQPRELEDLIDLLDRAEVSVRTVQAGTIELGTPAGRMTARIVGAVARGESEHKSARIKAKQRELAERGQVSGGGHRPFGYKLDRIAIDRREAKIVREMADRALAGEAIRGIASDLTRRQILTTTGKSWSTTAVRRILVSARIAGTREHKGDTFPAVWKPIVTEAELRRLRAILTHPARYKGRGKAPKLLTGLVICSKCGAKMLSRPKETGQPTYCCCRGPGYKGCGHNRILGEPLDEMIVEAVFRRLDGAGLADAVAATPEERNIDDELAEIAGKLRELGEQWAVGEIDETVRNAASAALTRRRSEIEAEMRVESTDRTLDGLGGGVLRESWPNMQHEQRRAVLAAVLDRVVIGPAVRGRNFFDTGRFDDPERGGAVVWKV